MAPEDQQVDTITGVGHGQLNRPQRGTGVRRTLVPAVSLLVGLAFTVLGVVFASACLAARWHFGDAQKVPAVVLHADYAKPHQKQSASSITVHLTGVHDVQASIDDVVMAPDGLSTGDHVTVLYSTSRPGHALFPSQLGWSKLLFPGGLFFLIGLVATIGHGLDIARRSVAHLRR